MVLTYFQKLLERLTGSTEEESHKAAALLQREVRTKQEPLSIQQCQQEAPQECRALLLPQLKLRKQGPVDHVKIRAVISLGTVESCCFLCSQEQKKQEGVNYGEEHHSQQDGN